jgi:hypothetical protein
MMINLFLRIRWYIILFALPFIIHAQDLPVKNTYGGMFSLGVRNVVSTFNDGVWGNMGVGTGGQFNIQANNRVNTAWFFDYIKGGVGDYANRTDYHIGWSVMYYLVPSSTEKLPKFQPYVLAGHCFDYTNFKDNSNLNNFAERWSSAVQAGMGSHYNLSKRMEIYLQAQYMIHLGTDIDAAKVNGEVVFKREEGVNLAGHILVSFGINFKIIDLW